MVFVERRADASALLFGLSLFMVPTTMSVAADDRVGPDHVNAAVSFLYIWSGIGPVLAGGTIDLSHTFLTVYLLSAICGAIAAVLAMGLRFWQERGEPASRC